MTVSNPEGDTVRQTSVRADPTDIQFSEMKGDERSQTGENTVSNIAINAWSRVIPCSLRSHST